jgi:carboxyl-terminal processing protease
VRWGGGLALAAALLAVLAAGLWLGGHPAKLPSALRDVFVNDSAGLNGEAAELIEDNYYRSVNAHQLSDASLQGMVRGLRRRYHDRFSAYFSPELLKRFDEEISGHFSGVGLVVSGAPRGLRVERALRGSPAARAGIRSGDLVVSVNGTSIVGKPIAVATAKIKGPEGTDVVIGVERPPSRKPREVHLTRAEIELPVVSSGLRTVRGRRLGFVHLTAFSEAAHAALGRAIRKLKERGAQGLVVDLRGNGGGLLDEAVLSAGLFLPKGEVVVSTSSRTQGHAVYRSPGGAIWSGMPVVVLIDGNTASAAEILTAALADDADATVVGTHSFGKGVFQQEVPLSNGGALKLTIGEYFTPNGTNLGGNPIQPDVKAADRPGTKADEGLNRALRVLAGEQRR